MLFSIVTSLLFVVFIERSIFSSSRNLSSVTKCTRRLARRDTYLQTARIFFLYSEHGEFLHGPDHDLMQLLKTSERKIYGNVQYCFELEWNF